MCPSQRGPPAGTAGVHQHDHQRDAVHDRHVLTPVGIPEFLNFPYINAGITKTSGIDIDLRGRFDFGAVGRLTAEVNYTYISQYETRDRRVSPTIWPGLTARPSISGEPAIPSSAPWPSLTWDKGPASVTLSANYTGAFRITDPTEGWTTCLTRFRPRGTVMVRRYRGGNDTGAAVGPVLLGAITSPDFNLYGRYAVTRSFLRARLRSGTCSILSRRSISQTYGGGALYRYTTLDQDGAVGRFFLLGATYKF